MPTRSSRRRLFARARGLVFGAPWVLMPQKLAQIAELLDLRAGGMEFTDAEIRDRCGLFWDDEEDEVEDEKPYTVADGVAVLNVAGTLLPRVGPIERASGVVSTQQMAEHFRAAMQDDEVRAVLLAMDTPGGAVTGVPEFADAVYSARGVKSVWAYNLGLMASGGYWIGTAAERVVAAKSSQTGSVGAYCVHGEASQANEKRGVQYTVISAGEHKTAGNPYEPLTDKARAVLQESIDKCYGMFVGAVAQHRRVSVEAVRDGYGRGKVLYAEDALAAGMIDAVGTFEDTLAALQRQVRSTTAGPLPTAGTMNRFAANGDQPSQRVSVSLKGGDPMDPKLKAALVARGLIAHDATDEVANVSLASFCAAQGVAVPTDAVQAHHIVMGGLTKPAHAHHIVTRKVDAEPVKTLEAAAAEGAKAEAERRDSLTALAYVLGVSNELLSAATADTTFTVEKAAKEWPAAIAKERKPVTRDTFAQSEGQLDRLVAAASDALVQRVSVSLGGAVRLLDKAGNVRVPHAAARDMARLGTYRMAEEICKARGIDLNGMDREDVCRAAMGIGLNGRTNLAAMASASFNGPGLYPNLLAAVANKVLEGWTPPAPSTYREWAKALPSVADFKPTTINRMSLGGELPRKFDNKEFEASRGYEEANFIAVDEYGEKFPVTPRMLADDDLSVFTEFLPAQLVKMERTLNRLCVRVLETNPTMPYDSVAFLATARGNLIQQADISFTTTNVGAARAAMRAFRGPDGADALGLYPTKVLVPYGQETAAELYFTPLGLVPATEAAKNPFQGRIKPMVEPMLTNAADYYFFTDAMLAAAVVYMHQQGFENGKRETWFDPDTGNQYFSIEARMAAAANNWRGVLKMEDSND